MATKEKMVLMLPLIKEVIQTTTLTITTEIIAITTTAIAHLHLAIQIVATTKRPLITPTKGRFIIDFMLI